MRRPRSRSYLTAALWLAAGSLLEQAGARRRARGRRGLLPVVDGDEQGYPRGVHSWSALIDWGRGR